MDQAPFRKVVPTPEQERALEVARVGFMAACPFYAHYFYAEMREFATLDIPTAATDGRTIFYNPEYLASLKPPERVFVLAHEVDHVISRHPQRFKTYADAGMLRGLDYDHDQMNVAADYTINAGLIETGVGLMNPSWMYADDVTGDDLSEDVFERKYQKPRQVYGQSSKAPKGAKKDATAAGKGGSFDEVLPPSVDPVTGKQDLPDEAEFREAVTRAAAAAKAMGKLPHKLSRRIEEILRPQVDWREHIRLTITSRIGNRAETWTRCDRRRLVIPGVFMPGRRGFGAEHVVVALDTSGSIYASPKALAAFFAEVGGILADVRPRRVTLIECDAEVQRVQDANSLDELDYAREQGVSGGGGTSFVPVFEHVAEQGWKPDTLIYLTDLMGAFPSDTPPYPVVWCSIMDGHTPWGEKILIAEEG